MRRRFLAVLAAAGIALTLAACGSSDNGGVIQGPTGTTAVPASTTPGATTATTAGGSGSGTPGY